MALVVCEVREGLRAEEATVVVRDYRGDPEFLPIDRDFLTYEGNKNYLPIGIIHIDQAKKLALIELPYEADSGAHRMWVKLSHLKQDSEIVQ